MAETEMTDTDSAADADADADAAAGGGGETTEGLGGIDPPAWRAWERHEDGDTRRAAVQAMAERRAGHFGRRPGARTEAAALVRVLRADCDVPPAHIAVAHRMLESPLSGRLAEAGITVRDLKRSCYFSSRLHTDYERGAALRAVEEGEAVSVSAWFVAVVRRRVADEREKLDLMDETLTYEEHRAGRSRLRSLGFLPDPDDIGPAAPLSSDGDASASASASASSAVGLPVGGSAAGAKSYVDTPADLAALIYGCDALTIRGRVWRADDREHHGRMLNLDALYAAFLLMSGSASASASAGGEVVPLIRRAPGPPPGGGGDHGTA